MGDFLQFINHYEYIKKIFSKNTTVKYAKIF